MILNGKKKKEKASELAVILDHEDFLCHPSLYQCRCSFLEEFKSTSKIFALGITQKSLLCNRVEWLADLVIQKKKKKFALGLSKSQKMLPHCENADRLYSHKTKYEKFLGDGFFFVIH